MPVSVSGSKTVSVDVSPVHTASKITTLMATPVENLKVSDLRFLFNCCLGKQGGEEPNATMGSLFS